MCIRDRWSTQLAREFERIHGYDLVPLLDGLWEDIDGLEERVRRDYHATRASLAERAIFKPLFDWHDQRGMIAGVDQQNPARAGDPEGGVRIYADYMKTHRWYGAPGSDHHGEAKIHSSLAHLYGRDRVWLEAFHTSGWGGTLEETFDWLLPWLRGGVTLYNPHATYYGTRGGWFEWAPPSTDWRQPYWSHYRIFADAVGRLSWLLGSGVHACDVAWSIQPRQSRLVSGLTAHVRRMPEQRMTSISRSWAAWSGSTSTPACSTRSAWTTTSSTTTRSLPERQTRGSCTSPTSHTERLSSRPAPCSTALPRRRLSALSKLTARCWFSVARRPGSP